jgi:hypothetical protein
MIKLKLFGSHSSNKWNLFSWGKSVRNTFNIKNDCNTSKNPFLRRKFGLQLGCENISVTSVLGFVDWAIVNVLIWLELWHDLGGSAVDNWHNGELLLWS